MMDRTILYSCPFVPGEWIEAHGLVPVRVISRRSAGPTPGVCPYAQAYMTECIASPAAGIVVTTACDQMRRAADAIAQQCRTQVFVLNLPHTWQTAASHRLYIAELKRLGAFLLERGGTEPTSARLADVMSRSQDARITNQPKSHSGVPIALLGGPLPQNSATIDLIENSGGYVALDGTETGERTRPAPFDRRRIHDDPLGTLADAYFGSIPDPFRRPNSEFFKWLKSKIDERRVRGIILRRYVWCDNWHAEAHRIQEMCGLPFLQIDVADDGSDRERMATRIEAFMEMLR